MEQYQRDPHVDAIFQRARVLLLHPIMPVGERRFLETTSAFLTDAGKQTIYKTHYGPPYNRPTTLQLFADQYHEKFDAACKRGMHKRVTRVHLANRLSTQSITLMSGGAGSLCKSWEDFENLKSIYIDVDALLNLKSRSENAHKQYMETEKKIETVRTRVHFGTIFKRTLRVHPGMRRIKQMKETNQLLKPLEDELNLLHTKKGDHDHFLSVLTIGGEKEVRLFVNVAKSSCADFVSDVFTVAAVLDRLEETYEQSVYTMPLPNGYIYKMD